MNQLSSGNNRVKLEIHEIYRSFKRSPENVPRMDEVKPEDVNI